MRCASGACASAAPAIVRTARRPEVEFYAVEVREIDPPEGEEPILWRLLTTHRVETFSEARAVIAWYRLRWNIEQLFRTLKTQGLGIEQSVVADGEALEKLVVIALIVATMTMQLVLARTAADGEPRTNDSRGAAGPAAAANHGLDAATPAPAPAPAPASRIFDKDQVKVLHALQVRLQGRTEKQKNPYRPETLAWAAWTIARLGGWSGYKSDKSSGPITMRDGLQRFCSITDGYELQKMCAQASPVGER